MDNKDMSIPMSSPDLTNIEIETVNQVLRTPYLSIGPWIGQFEQRFAAYIGRHNSVGVSSGTAGLHLCVLAAGISEADLVITTPFSFIASANCILYEKAFPIFVDVDRATGNIDPYLVAECADDLLKNSDSSKRWLPRSIWNQKTRIRNLKSILPVHCFGQPAEMDSIAETARRSRLIVIEDACEAIGAEYKGRSVGTLGDLAVFAFYPNKQMTTGEGGIIVNDRNDWDVLLRSLRNQGRNDNEEWLSHNRLGYNYRLDEMSAALGLAQLIRIEELLSNREKVASWYNMRLAEVELVERPYISPNITRMSWFVYVVRIKPPANRNEVMRKLAELRVPSRPYFSAIHLQPFYREKFGYQSGDFPITEYLSDVSLALPFSGVMKEEQVEYVCNAIKKILQG